MKINASYYISYTVHTCFKIWLRRAYGRYTRDGVCTGWFVGSEEA